MKTGGALLFLIFALSCSVGEVSTGGGGAFVPSGTSTSPVLLSVTLTPDKVPSSSTVTFHVRFTFSDSDGDLEGGTLTYVRQGATGLPISIPTLSNPTAGQSPTLIFNETLTPTVGRVLFQFILTDRAGNRSNVFSFYLTQT